MGGKVTYGVAPLPLFYCGRRGIEPGAGRSPASCFAARIELTDQRSGGRTRAEAVYEEFARRRAYRSWPGLPHRRAPSASGR